MAIYNKVISLLVFSVILVSNFSNTHLLINLETKIKSTTIEPNYYNHFSNPFRQEPKENSVILHENTTLPPSLGNIFNDKLDELVIAEGKYIEVYKFSTYYEGKYIYDFSQYGINTITTSPKLVDVDHDGVLDIVVGDNNGSLAAYSIDKGILPGFPIKFDGSILNTLATTDFDSDSKPEIVFSTKNCSVYIISNNGTVLKNWPKHLKSPVTLPILLTDLNGDKIPEIIAAENKGVIHVWDFKGNDIFSWPIDLHYNITKPLAAADFNNDNFSEIVVASTNKLFLIDKNGFNLISWPKILTDDLWLAPIIADVDFNGKLDILAATKRGDFYVFDYKGKEQVHFKAAVNDILTNDPILIADDRNYWALLVNTVNALYIIKFNPNNVILKSTTNNNIVSSLMSKDGLVFILLQNGIIEYLDIWSSRVLYPWKCIHGNNCNTRADTPQLEYKNLPPWPIEFGSTDISAITIADINSDGRPEIIEGHMGGVSVVSYNGTVLWSRTCVISTINVLWVFAEDLDNDNDIEVIAANVKRLYVWDSNGSIELGFPFDFEDIRTFNIADINNDSIKELIVGVGNKIFITEPYTANFSNWPKEFNSTVLSVHPIDLNKDGKLELFVILEDNMLLLSSSGEVLSGWSIKYLSNFCSMIFVDVNNDSNLEIVVLFSTGLVCYDIQGNVLQDWPQETLHKYIYSANIKTSDINKDGKQEILIYTGDVFYALNLSGSILWEKTVFSSYSESNNHFGFIVGNLDGDCEDEIVLYHKNYGIGVYEHDGTLKYTFLASPLSLVAADVNDDTKIELVFGTPKQLGILQTSGSGRFPSTISTYKGQGQYTILDTDTDGISDSDEKILGSNPFNNDTDGDGVNDYIELCYHADLNYNDTDMDGLSDYNEIIVYKTDPTSNDTDKDGLSDYNEIFVQHTNPLIYDTDLDGAGDGFEVLGGSDPTVFSPDFDGDGDGLSIFYEAKIHSNPNKTDTDNDGLNDYEEWILCSNPNSQDSDNDGLNDYDEVHIYSTNLVSNDTDSDYINDYDEIFVYHTKPTLNDTDGDQMIDGYEILYNLNPFVSTDALYDNDTDGLINFVESKFFTNPFDNDTDSDELDDRWEVYTGTNPLINDANEDLDQDTLTNLLEYKIGTLANSTDSEGDNMPDAWEYSHSLNPLFNDSSDDPDQDLLINLYEYHFLTDPHDNDTDRDLMPDGWEVFNNINPLIDDANEDTDYDDLTNYEEYIFGTCPTNFDTDKDGIPDGWEVKNGLNPTDENDATEDLDWDGLNNLMEYLINTEVNNPDTDGDGLLDGEEFYIYGTWVKKYDSDYDGLSDGDEIKIYNTNPLDDDTDGDGFRDRDEVVKGTDPLNPYSNIRNQNVFRIRYVFTLVLVSLIVGGLIKREYGIISVFKQFYYYTSPGFESEEEMERTQMLGYKTKKEALQSFNKGFFNKNEEIAAKLLGVPTAAEFVKLVKMFIDYLDEELKIRKNILNEISKSIDFAIEETTFNKIQEIIPLEFKNTYEEFNEILNLMSAIADKTLKEKTLELLEKAKIVSSDTLNLIHKLEITKERVLNFKIKFFD